VSNEQVVPEAAGSQKRRRLPVLGTVAAVLLAMAGALLFVRIADPFNPYRSGTSHSAKLVLLDSGCANGWGVVINDGPRHYGYTNGVAPTEWQPGPVEGTLRIIKNWGGTGTDATFEARCQVINLQGGRDDHYHFSSPNCSIGG
jgi:hypothetical protein